MQPERIAIGENCNRASVSAALAQLSGKREFEREERVRC
jgi:hypothetical protein